MEFVENISKILLVGAMFGVFALPFVAMTIMFFTNKHKKVKKA